MPHKLLTLLILAIFVGAIFGARTFGGTVRLGCFLLFIFSGCGLLVLLWLMFGH